MTASARMICIVILFAAASVSHAAGPTAVLHDPPASARMGQPLSMEVELEGITGARPSVSLHYRGQGGRGYTNQEMTSEGRGRWSWTIPGKEIITPALKYYIEVKGPGGTYRARVGSAERPLSLTLELPQEEAGFQLGAGSAALAAGLSLLSAAGLLWNRRRKRRLLQQLFWLRTLRRLVPLRGESLAAELEALSSQVLDNPVEGPRTYTKQELKTRLGQVRGLDAGKLAEDGERVLGSEGTAELQAPAMAAEEVNDRLAKLAFRVGRMCAAAWLLASRDGKASTERKLLQPFDEARRSVQAVQKDLKEGDPTTAARRVERLARQERRLLGLTRDLDTACSSRELALALAGKHAMTADMLGHLLEYYAMVAEPTPETRDKLVVVTQALVESDGLTGEDPGRIRQALRRRGLLGGGKEGLAPKLVKRAAELRMQAIALTPRSSSELEPLRQQMLRYQSELGESLTSIAGLSEAVALRLKLEEKQDELERAEAGSLDSMMSDLEWCLEEVGGNEDAALEAGEDDDPMALELIKTAEREIAECVADGSYAEAEFHLEATEVKAFTTLAQGGEWAPLVVRAAACRAAIDRLAQRHSRAGHPEGHEPPPLPEATALTLVRKAEELERDLHDMVQRDLMHDRLDRAEQTKRFSHRFKRCIMGLALLARLPVAV